MEGAEQPAHDAYVYAIRDEEAYLQVSELGRTRTSETGQQRRLSCPVSTNLARVSLKLARRASQQRRGGHRAPAQPSLGGPPTAG